MIVYDQVFSSQVMYKITTKFILYGKEQVHNGAFEIILQFH